MMNSHYQKVKTKLGFGAKINDESDTDEKVIRNKGFRKFMKNKSNSYFNKKKTISKAPRAKSGMSIRGKDHQTITPLKHPYSKIFNDFGTNFGVTSSTRTSQKIHFKNVNEFLREDFERASTTAKSNLFSRPSTQLNNYRCTINSDYEQIFDRSGEKSAPRQRVDSAFSKRRRYHPPIKAHENPASNPLFNKSLFTAESEKLVKPTFDWKKVANLKHIQKRIENRMQYLQFSENEHNCQNIKIKNSKKS